MAIPSIEELQTQLSQERAYSRMVEREMEERTEKLVAERLAEHTETVKRDAEARGYTRGHSDGSNLDPKNKASMDQTARHLEQAIKDQIPMWINEALSELPMKEKQLYDREMASKGSPLHPSVRVSRDIDPMKMDVMTRIYIHFPQRELSYNVMGMGY